MKVNHQARFISLRIRLSKHFLVIVQFNHSLSPYSLSLAFDSPYIRGLLTLPSGHQSSQASTPTATPHFTMRLIIIDQEGNLTVEVVEYDESIEGGSDNDKVVKERVQFLVKRDVLTTQSCFFDRMLQRDTWKESSQKTVMLTDRVKRLEVCFRVLHKCKDEDHIFNFSLEEIWYLVEAIDYYHFDVKLFKPWFATWHNKQAKPFADTREIVYPTWRFDLPKAFAMWTRALCYDKTHHITEHNPSKVNSLHLPPRIIRKIHISPFLFSLHLLTTLRATERRQRTYSYYPALWTLRAQRGVAQSKLHMS